MVKFDKYVAPEIQELLDVTYDLKKENEELRTKLNEATRVKVIEITPEMVEKVEDAIGVGKEAWDTVDHEELLLASYMTVWRHLTDGT